VTGARANRRELLNLLAAIAPGDVVTVACIDRLARSTFDLFGIVKRITDAKAQFRSLAEPWADTGTSTGRLRFSAGWPTWSAILSAPAPPRAAAGRRSAGNTWADRRNSRTSSRKKRGGGARRARHLPNWPAATV
jgi:hypothetical protein